jgi:hypothetical protein
MREGGSKTGREAERGVRKGGSEDGRGGSKEAINAVAITLPAVSLQCCCEC